MKTDLTDIPPPLNLDFMSQPESAAKLIEFKTTRFTSKMWLTPENEFLQLHSWHYEWFRDNPVLAKKYGVTFGEEQATRLAALRVGFVRINYERNGGILTMETMRWDRSLRNLIDQFIFDNEEALDHVRINVMDKASILVQVGYVSIMEERRAGRPINRFTLGSWNNFRMRKI